MGQRYRSLFEESRDMMHIVSADDGCIVDVNQAELDTLGYSREEMIGKPIVEFVAPEFREETAQRIRRILQGEALSLSETVMLAKDGGRVDVELSATPQFEDGKVVVARAILRDIRKRKMRELLETDQRHILECVVDTSVTLNDVLRVIIEAIQRQRPGMIGSILLLDEDGKHLRAGVAPNLPDVYNNVFDGAEIGPVACSCGTAAFRGERVIVADIAHDPLWQDYKQLALSHGLAACWSEPVFDSGACLLGTFAMYYAEAREPDQDDIKLIEQASTMAAYAITHKRQDMELRENEQRFRCIFESTFDAQVIVSNGKVVLANHALAEDWGGSEEEIIGRDISDFIHPEDRAMVAEQHSKRIANDDVAVYSARFVDKHGKVHWVEISGCRITYKGEHASFVAVRDMSVIKNAEQQMRTILETNPVPTIVTRMADGTVKYANAAVSARFDIDAVGEKTPDYFVHPEERAEIMQALAENKSVTVREVLLKKSNGIRFWALVSLAMMDVDDEPCVIAAIYDIDERKQAEAALKRREEQLQVLAEAGRSINETLDEKQVLRLLVRFALQLVQAEAGCVGVYRDGKMVFSEYLRENTFIPIDYSFSEGYGVPGHVLFTRQSYLSNDAAHDKHVIPEIRQALGFHRLVDTPILDGEGNVLGCFEIHDAPSGRDFDAQDVEMLRGLSGIVSGALQNARLIGELTETTDSLKTSEQRYRHLVEVLPDGVVLVEDGKVVFANSEALELFGFEYKQAIGQPIAERIHPDDRAAAMARVQKLLREEGGMNPLLEERMLRRDGTEFVVETASAYAGYEGRAAVLVVLRDVSERVNAQKAARQAAERIAAVARNMTGIVFQFGVLPDGRWYFPYISESVERLLGVSAADGMANAQYIFDRVLSEDMERFMHAVKTAIEQQASFYWEGCFVHLDGTVRWFNCSSEPQQLDDGTLVWNGVAVDETEQHDLEAQFRQAQKMEAVGTLVGGIAHDFNNMLAGMLGQLYMMRHELQADAALNVASSLQRIDAVERQGKQAAEVIAQLMTFARKGQVEMSRLDVNRLVSDALRLHRVSIPENIELKAHLGDALKVEGDAGLIQQVLLNLLTNARDALEDTANPCIEINLTHFVPDADSLAVHAEFTLDAYARLSVCDNGCGMSAKQIERIFDPFFTTKEVGKGTGLGLAMLYGAMQTHHGFVLVDSTPGEGSCFNLFFPIVSSTEEISDSEEVKLVRGSGQCILLVDDQQELLEIMQESLESIGYKVLTAHNGAQAVTCFAAHRDVIALAMLDVVMPVQGGVEAARELREMRPDLPIVFHSGYGEEAKLDSVRAWQACEIVKKPSGIERLSQVIASLIS